MYVLLLFILLLANAQDKIHKSNPSQNKQQHTAKNASSKPLAAVSQNSPSPQPTPSTKGDNQQSNTDGWFKGYVIFTGVIAAINLFMLIAMWRQKNLMGSQLEEMRKTREQSDRLIEQAAAQVAEMKAAGIQTGDLISQGAAQVAALNYASGVALKTAEAAKTGADAALRNAKAAEITAERFAQIEGAQIIVDLEWLPGGKRSYGSGTNGPTTGLPLAAKCRNEGKRIASIREIRLTAQIFQNIIPANPSFDVDILWHGMEHVAPNDFAKKDESIILYGQDGLGEWIIIWGIVKYSDTFSDTRETTFGYIVSLDGELNRLGLPAYNKHT